MCYSNILKHTEILAKKLKKVVWNIKNGMSNKMADELANVGSGK